MAVILKYHTFSDGYIPAALISAARLNTNWDRLYTLVNGALDNDNMSSGYHLVVTVATIPAWTSSYVGHIIYCTDTGKLWFGGTTAFQEITPSHALLSTSHSDSVPGAVVKGHIIYGNSTPAWAALAGDNTGTRKFFVMTSLVPSWASLSQSDLPTVKLDDWAAPDNNTDLDATTAAHGLCPKGNDSASAFLNGDLDWAVVTRANVTPAILTFTALDTTPSVSGGVVFKTHNLNHPDHDKTLITMFDGGYSGQEITVIINDPDTAIYFAGSYLKGNGGVNWNPGTGCQIRAVFDGTYWYCDCALGAS